MKRHLFMLFLYAALLASGAAFAEPGEAEVVVTDGRLSVTAQNAAIGNIISEISQQAGFELDINPEVSQKTVTTRFSNIDIQKGIERLLSLIRHKDYFIYYGPDGDISKIEIHGADGNASSAVQRSRTPNPRDSRRNATPRRMPPRPQMRPTPPLPNGMDTRHQREPYPPEVPGMVPPPSEMPPMPINPGEEIPPMPEDYPIEDMPDGMVPPPPTQPEDMDSTPYIPPARMPAYIPPNN